MEKNEPIHEIKLRRIRATIWANETKDQEVWFNVTVSRLYKDGDKWKDTTSFRRDDLPLVAKAVDMAYTWILLRERKLEQQERESRRDNGRTARRA
jgi:hypothetical protein